MRSVFHYHIKNLCYLLVFKINNDINELATSEKKTFGGIASLLTLITFGIYGIYWSYKMGKLLDDAKVRRGEQPQNRAVVYLILQLTAFGLIWWILMQSSINSMIEARPIASV